ncbi:MAG: hypothetical protein J0M04_18345 [Verrucomicrobia bacterium]|nr:hypothetical protein [Verrucomicrobiota bacterium]
MKLISSLCLALIAAVTTAPAQVRVDADAFGGKLGGWTKRDKKAAEYVLSGTTYRTYKPEISPTPDGGLFVSLRIDHVRGWLSSDDHAVLEVTVSAKGEIESAQSTIALQGRSVTSDLIRSGTDAGQKMVGVDRAVQIGTDLVADVSAKLLREKLVEPGRVSYPAALRHNYNLLFQAVRVDPPTPPAPAAPVAPAPGGDQPAPATPPNPEPPAPAPETPSGPLVPAKPAPKLEINGPGQATKTEIPAKK